MEYKKLLRNQKKGQMGLGVAKTFVIALLSLIVIGVTIMVVLNSLGDTSVISTDTNSVTNETGAFINSIGYEFDNQGVGDITVTEARNASDGTTISDTEYTVTDGKLYNATATTYSDVNVDYTYEVNSDSQNVLDNSSSGMTSFFDNTTTWLALLAVVIIILIISVVVNVVNQFGKGQSGGSL